MTDKAEMLVDALIEACEYGRVIVVSGGVNKPDLDLARSALVALIASQAAEIERLRFESDQLRHVKLGLEVQVMEQAAYIERLRGRIRIAEGTLVAWLREQGGGVDPVRHALATLRNMP